MPLLDVKDLKTYFRTDDGIVHAVDGVSFSVDKGKTLAIVGESGCGKSVTCMTIMGLNAKRNTITEGQAIFKDRDLLKIDPDELRKIRGNEISMIFQDPMTSLNPVLRVGFQVEEAMAAHRRFTSQQSRDRVIPLLQRVRIPAAKERVRDFPHQFSGGMRQRAMIAMGVSNEPSLLIADEPTTALDVTVQASIIELVRDLSRELRAAVMLITHNMALVASLCNRVIVMYAGRIVEEGPTRAIFKNPQHPYTWSLLRSMPRADEVEKERLISIKGLPPDLGRMPPGCKFHPRCAFRIDRCMTEEPTLDEVGPGQVARCWVLMKNVSDPEAAAKK